MCLYRPWPEQLQRSNRLGSLLAKLTEDKLHWAVSELKELSDEAPGPTRSRPRQVGGLKALGLTRDDEEADVRVSIYARSRAEEAPRR